MKIKYKYCSDWAEIFIDGELLYKNHSIPESIWIELLKKMGAEIEFEEMEESD